MNGGAVGTKTISLAPNAQGSKNLGVFLGIAPFKGSIRISSTVPVISLSLNFEAAPVFSALPPGEITDTRIGPRPYYFAHIAAGERWRTTFTYVNDSTQPESCTTSFYSKSGIPLALMFNGSSSSIWTRTIPIGGTVRMQTDANPSSPVVTGWARSDCVGPVKASALFRSYQGEIPEAEASVIAMTSGGTDFTTYADQLTGVAYANPFSETAEITFTARDLNGVTVGTKTISLAPHAQGACQPGCVAWSNGFQRICKDLFNCAYYQSVPQLRGCSSLFHLAPRRRGADSLTSAQDWLSFLPFNRDGGHTEKSFTWGKWPRKKWDRNVSRNRQLS